MPMSKYGLSEHGRGLPCGELPMYNDISSDILLDDAFNESSKFNLVTLNRR